jgi:hypothetical protein
MAGGEGMTRRHLTAFALLAAAGSIMHAAPASAACIVPPGTFIVHQWSNNAPLWFDNGGCQWSATSNLGVANAVTKSVSSWGGGATQCAGVYQRSVGVLNGNLVNGTLVLRGLGGIQVTSFGPGSAFGVGTLGTLTTGQNSGWINDALYFC